MLPWEYYKLYGDFMKTCGYLVECSTGQLEVPLLNAIGFFYKELLKSLEKERLNFGGIFELENILVLILGPASPGESHGDVSWVGSTPSSPVQASLQLLALQLKPSLSGLRAPEHPLFTLSLLVLIKVTRQGRKG